jgi:predicted nucleic-acid-binding Zn-ribbon protein
MKIQQHQTDVIIQPEKRGRKNKRRHTRTHLDSLRPIPLGVSEDSLSQCPKCQGLIFFEPGETMRQTIVRCHNCGWQPHFQAPIIRETEESRMMRTLTNEFVFGSGWDRLPVGW